MENQGFFCFWLLDFISKNDIGKLLFIHYQKNMKPTPIAHIYADYKQFLDKDILLNGWIKSVRDSKTFGFIELNDGSYLKNIQIVFENNLSNFDEICKFTTGSSITIE